MVRNNKALEVQQRFNYCNLSQQTSLCCSRCEVPRAWSRTWLITREAYLLLLCSRSLWHTHQGSSMSFLMSFCDIIHSSSSAASLVFTSTAMDPTQYHNQPNITGELLYCHWKCRPCPKRSPNTVLDFLAIFAFPVFFFFAQHYGWKMGGNTKTAVGSENFQKRKWTKRLAEWYSGERKKKKPAPAKPKVRTFQHSRGGKNHIHG